MVWLTTKVARGDGEKKRQRTTSEDTDTDEERRIKASCNYTSVLLCVRVSPKKEERREEGDWKKQEDMVVDTEDQVEPKSIEDSQWKREEPDANESIDE